MLDIFTASLAHCVHCSCGQTLTHSSPAVLHCAYLRCTLSTSCIILCALFACCSTPCVLITSCISCILIHIHLPNYTVCTCSIHVLPVALYCVYLQNMPLIICIIVCALVEYAHNHLHFVVHTCSTHSLPLPYTLKGHLTASMTGHSADLQSPGQAGSQQVARWTVRLDCHFRTLKPPFRSHGLL